MHPPSDDDSFRAFRPPDWAALGAHPSEWDIPLDDHVFSEWSPDILRWNSTVPDDDLVWVSLEVWDESCLDGQGATSSWATQAWWSGVSDGVVAGAFHDGAQRFDVVFREWGCVIQFGFRSPAEVTDFLFNPALKAAFDQLDQLTWLRVNLVFGRGGGAGVRKPRGPRPNRDTDAAEAPLPEPDVTEFVNARAVFLPTAS